VISFAETNLRGKANTEVTAVAERLVLRVPAPAQENGTALAKVKLVPLPVHEPDLGKIPAELQSAVVHDLQAQGANLRFASHHAAVV
jgi:hypothetical protein